MSDKDTKSHELFANAPKDIAKKFNLSEQQAQRVASASPEAKGKASDRLKLRDQRVDKELRNQNWKRKSRKAFIENRMLKQYVLEDVPRPNDPEARKQDIAIIAEQADRQLAEQEAHFINQISREAEQDVWQILRNDQEQVQDHTQDYEHDQEY
jgi:hypothetical protein